MSQNVATKAKRRSNKHSIMVNVRLPSTVAAMLHVLNVQSGRNLARIINDSILHEFSRFVAVKSNDQFEEQQLRQWQVTLERQIRDERPSSMTAVAELDDGAPVVLAGVAPNFERMDPEVEKILAGWPA